MTKNLGEAAQRWGPAPIPRALRVVIADDDRDSVLTLMMLFRHEGDEVRGVYAGRNVLGAAIKILAQILGFNHYRSSPTSTRTRRSCSSRSGFRKPWSSPPTNSPRGS